MIYLLTGGMKRNADGTFRTLGLEDSDRGLLCNDSWRVTAVALAWKHQPTNVLVSGGKNPPRDPEDGPTLAEVNERELIVAGVDPSSIIRDDKGNSTYRQLMFLSDLVGERIATGNSETITLVSNEWHLPRVMAMMQFAPGLENLRDLESSVTLASAESILMTLGLDKDKWISEVRRVRVLPEYSARASAEAEGIRQIITGEYRFV